MNVELTKLELKIVLGALSEMQDAMDMHLSVLLRWCDSKTDEPYLLAEETKRLYKTVFERLCNDYGDKVGLR